MAKIGYIKKNNNVENNKGLCMKLLKHLSVNALALTIFISANALVAMGPPTDSATIAQNYKPEIMFDQQAVLSNQTYSTIFTREQQGIADQTESDTLDKALEDEFFRQQKLLFWKPLKEKIVSTVLPFTMGLSIWGMAGSIWMCAEEKLITIPAPATMAAFIVAGSGFLATLVTSIPLVLNLPTIIKLAQSVIKGKSDYPLLKYELAYVRKKRFLDLQNQSSNAQQSKSAPYFEEMFSLAHQQPEHLPKIILMLESLLSIPVKSKSLKLDVTKNDWLDLYDKQTQRVIMRTCMNHVDSFNSQRGINDRPREFLSLFSPPGTGKTQLVRTMAKIMDLPIVTVCLANCSAEKLFGTESQPGLLLEKLGQLSHRNGILFLDELDRAVHDQNLLSMLLPFLEPNEKRFYSPYLQQYIDVSHLLIVVAGNASLEEAALQSRFHALKTTNLTIENRSKFISLIMNDYLNVKVSHKVSLLIDDALKAQWQQSIMQYIEQQPYISFRDAQAKLDTLIADWRISQAGKEGAKA